MGRRIVLANTLSRSGWRMCFGTFEIQAFEMQKTALTTRFFAQISFWLSQYGRSDTTRTCDPFIPNEVRYQLRYTPTAFLLYMINTGVSTDSRRKILRKRKFILKKDLQNTRSCGNISKYDCQMGIYTLICVEAGGCGSAPDCSRFFRGVCPILNRAKEFARLEPPGLARQAG